VVAPFTAQSIQGAEEKAEFGREHLRWWFGS
jgi:hypothetical protein